jgi:hypothetical protein
LFLFISDGTISIEELANFLFPEDVRQGNDLEYEPGIIYDLARKALVRSFSSVAAQGSDDSLLTAFANLAKATVRKGHLEDRMVKKAFMHLFIPEFSRNLKEQEVCFCVYPLCSFVYLFLPPSLPPSPSLSPSFLHHMV